MIAWILSPSHLGLARTWRSSVLNGAGSKHLLLEVKVVCPISSNPDSTGEVGSYGSPTLHPAFGAVSSGAAKLEVRRLRTRSTPEPYNAATE